MTGGDRRDDGGELRRRAEEAERARAGGRADRGDPLSPEAALDLIHDLRVHQVELEMQNDELRRTQAALEASQARYADLYELAPVGYLTLDEAFRILAANLTAAVLLGLPRVELPGKPLAVFFTAEDQDAFHHFRVRLAGSPVREVCELRLRRTGGAPGWVRLEAARVAGAGGPPTWRAVLSDVSERKRVEAQLQVSDRMAAVGVLAAGVAHEINNPLAIVMGQLDLALDEEADGAGREATSPASLAGLRAARDAAERIRLVVGDLRTLSRSGEDEHHGPVDVGGVLEVALRMAANQIRHRAQVVRELAPTPPVDANASRLGQVFLNLILNAAQAIPEGNLAANRLRVATSVEPGERVLVAIGDTGSGMPPEVLERLFTPFFTTKPVGAGMGLGLSICHRIVGDLGGEIRVESRIGQGTTVRVLLPAARPGTVRSPGAPAAPRRPRPAARRGRILVIDDEPELRSLIEAALGPDHFVELAERAEEALALLAGGERFDLILCDLMMPQVTGMEFHDRVATGFPDQLARIVFMTGGAFSPWSQEFLGRVPNRSLAKPFALAELRELARTGVDEAGTMPTGLPPGASPGGPPPGG